MPKFDFAALTEGFLGGAQQGLFSAVEIKKIREESKQKERGMAIQEADVASTIKTRKETLHMEKQKLALIIDEYLTPKDGKLEGKEKAAQVQAEIYEMIVRPMAEDIARKMEADPEYITKLGKEDRESILRFLAWNQSYSLRESNVKTDQVYGASGVKPKDWVSLAQKEDVTAMNAYKEATDIKIAAKGMLEANQWNRYEDYYDRIFLAKTKKEIGEIVDDARSVENLPEDAMVNVSKYIANQGFTNLVSIGEMLINYREGKVRAAQYRANVNPWQFVADTHEVPED